MKVECEQCHSIGYLQRVTDRYFRIRHYKNLHPTTKKPQFEYHRISTEYALEQLRLASKPLTPNLTYNHDQYNNSFDPKLNNSGIESQNRPWAGSSVRIEHQPPKLVVVGSNPTPPAIVLENNLDSWIFGSMFFGSTGSMAFTVQLESRRLLIYAKDCLWY